ncbi:MAG TPA: hypothetical protein VGX25_05685 [Actinophytocola sp.]|uniref:SCO6745 family protein n=1 Tax=Actinophytocola sp. TaxID=1872138 RepID=UPI002DDD7D74|nr:hypothetical protein [Actinophytocola sp.]HEV2778875.1 hypothetical protein [Actinophytocola sp.]
MSDLAMVRQMWQLLEPVHAPVYYAPEVIEEAAALGYAADAFWARYFAVRSAPLGPAGPELVSATFYSFSPAKVRRHVPAAWNVAAPADVLRARVRGVDRFYRRLLGAAIDGPEIAEAARLARTAAESATTAGRPLAAANADQPWPDEPHLALWHATTVLREHRGDGHVAALLTAGLDPCESLVSFAAVDAAPKEVFTSRGWTDDEWAAATARLAARGILDGAGTATPQGKELRASIERHTDELAAAPWRTLGQTGATRLAQLTMPIMQTVVRSGLLPKQNTLGIKPRKPAPEAK